MESVVTTRSAEGRATIRQLSQSVINKIAAGEVIERPASVVKEMLENSIDAGAMRIDVTVAGGGIELIRITDDGCGIPPEELQLALAAHATSKIGNADDLFCVETLGFRGEALASIAEVSHLTLRSRTRDSDSAYEIESHGGRLTDVVPIGASCGTTIEVRNLLFNTPVRKKFLRSAQTELGHVGDAFQRIALAHPQVHFTLRHNDKLVYDLPPANPWLARIKQFFGQELADALLWVESDQGDTRLWGYVANPSQSRSNPKMQHLFLNGRFVRDRSLQHALGEAYRGLLLTGRYPIAFLCFAMPPEQIDVNVHPTKLEVRLQHGDRMYGQLLSTLRNRFLSTDLNARLRPVGGPNDEAASGAIGSNTPGSPSTSGTSSAGDDNAFRQQVVAWANDQLTRLPQPAAGSAAAGNPLADATGGSFFMAAREAGSGGVEPSRGSGELLTLHRIDRGSTEARPFDPAADPRNQSAVRGIPWTGSSATDVNEAFDEAAADRHGHLPGHLSEADRELGRDGSASFAHHRSDVADLGPFPAAELPREHVAPTMAAAVTRAIQVHNRYLIAESDDGVVIIDQHALHERILYEQLRAKILSGALESQRLLVPEPVDLSPAEAAAVLQHADELAKLGIGVEPFGGDTILVTRAPARLSHLSPAELIKDMVDRLVADGKTPDRRDLWDDLLNMMACKAAIKAGDKLTPDEIAALLEQRHLVQDTHHCPHGRPTALVYTRAELDKQFKRT